MSELTYAILQFTTENPSLKAKREEAIKYLGDKWILAKKVERKTDSKGGLYEEEDKQTV